MLERREADVGLGAGREGGGLEAALDSSPVSLLHVHTFQYWAARGTSWARSLVMGRARPAGIRASWAMLGLLSKEKLNSSETGPFLSTGLGTITWLDWRQVGERLRWHPERQTCKEMELGALPANSLANGGFVLPAAQANSRSQGTHAFFLSRRTVSLR